MTFFVKKFAVWLLSAAATSAWASDLALILSTGAGGQHHQYAMALQPLLQQWLDRTVYIEFRPGGNGIIAAQTLINGKRPALLILGANKNFAVNQLEDIVPVAYLGQYAQVVFSNPASGITTFKQLVHSQKVLTYGVVNGNPVAPNMAHYAMSIARQTNGLTTLQELLYKSSPDILRDVLGNHINLGVSVLGTATGAMAREGKIVPLAILGPHRSKVLPDVPTLAELGYAWANDFYMAQSLLFASKETDSNTIKLIQQNLLAWLTTASAQATLAKLDYTLNPDMLLKPHQVIRAINQ